MSDDRVEPFAMPDRIAIDAKGYGWRVWDDDNMWSMVPVNPDNSPIPQPVTWFVPEGAREGAREADRRRITELETELADFKVENDDMAAAGMQSYLDNSALSAECARQAVEIARLRANMATAGDMGRELFQQNQALATTARAAVDAFWGQGSESLCDAIHALRSVLAARHTEGTQ